MKANIDAADVECRRRIAAREAILHEARVLAREMRRRAGEEG